MWEALGCDQKSIISKSNSNNVIASMKNFIENDRQADPKGQVQTDVYLIFCEYV